jgi:hypothetical protein
MFRKKSLPPVGVHIHSNGVEIVVTEDDRGVPVFKNTAEVAISSTENKSLREAQIEALLAAKEKLGLHQADCVLAASPVQVQTKRFEVIPKLSERDLREAAHTEAKELMQDSGEIVFSLDPLPNTNAIRMLSVVRRSDVEELVEIAKSAGLNPIAIDNPLAAWQRSCIERTDAILDLTYQRPVLYVFAKPIGEIYLLAANLVGAEKLGGAVRRAFVDMRRKLRGAAVQRLHIVGNYPDIDQLIEILKEERGLLEIGQFQMGGHVNPPWAFAAALATWYYANPKRSKV